MFQNVSVRDLMGGSESTAELRNGAIISIHPTSLLRKWYEYIQRLSSGGFPLALESDSISYNSLQLADQSTS